MRPLFFTFLLVSLMVAEAFAQAAQLAPIPMHGRATTFIPTVPFP